MLNICICIGLLLISIGQVYGEWTIETNQLHQYTLSYTYPTSNISYPVIYEACPEFIDSDKGTRISVCDTALYTLHNKSTAFSQKDEILGTYTEYILDYSPISNKYLPEVNCVFKILDIPKNSIIIQLNLSKKVSTNWISPLSNGKWDIQTDAPQTRILNVPPDNDLQSYYVSQEPSIITKGTSNYVTAFYEYSSNSSKGLIVGFLDHNIFKTGIEYTNQNINAVAGINGLLLTRDRIPHGIVNVSHSPMLFIHMNNDWRYGMEEYANMIAKISPQSKSIQSLSGSNPISGWNSWAMSVGHIGEPNETNLLAASDVLGNLTLSGFGPKQYIVRDAIYNLNQSQTDIWDKYVHNKPTQYTGTYTSPFIIYDEQYKYVNCNSELCIPSNTSKHCYVFNEIILKDNQGEEIKPILQNIYKYNQRILDVTHPATSCIFNNRAQEIKYNNMSLIKLDFLNYGAYEGNYYNKSIATTGMQAYTHGLNMIYTHFNNILTIKPYILDYGISLPFPVGPGMTMRRHTCDQMYGGIAYSMNAYTYGWWLSRFYMLNPDVVAFQENYWFKPPLAKITKTFSLDYKSRVLKAVVFGGFYASGDDLSNQTNAKLVQTYMGNININQIWSKAQVGYPNTMFRPVSYMKESLHIPFISAITPSLMYVRDNGDVAIFNFGLYTKLYSINITTHIPLLNKSSITCKDIWNNQTYIATNHILDISIPKTSSLVFECR